MNLLEIKNINKSFDNKQIIKNAEKIVLPGVGAFEDAAKKRFDSGLAQVVIDRANAGVPILGVCLGWT